jgi:hypothetical protein
MVMRTPVPIRALHPTTCDFAEIVSGLLDLDPDDHEQWHVLFINLDQWVPRSPATYEVIAQLARAIDALARDEEAEAMRLVEAARSNRARVRRLQEYVPASTTPATGRLSLHVAARRRVLRIVGGTGAPCGGDHQQAMTIPRATASPGDQALLECVEAAGDTAHLTFVSGPHAGKSLAEVARGNPHYLKRLAASAQRSDVRAAARRMCAELEPAAAAQQRWQSPRGART